MLIRNVKEAVAGRALVSVAPDETILDACLILDRENIGALAVLEGGALAGILSERDVIRRAVARRMPLETTRVGDIMTLDPQTVGPETPLVLARDLMIRGGFRHLPIVDDTAVLGMLSLRDIPARYGDLHERFEAAFTELEEAVARQTAGG